MPPAILCRLFFVLCHTHARTHAHTHTHLVCSLWVLVASLDRDLAMPLIQCPYCQYTGTHFADFGRMTGRVKPIHLSIVIILCTEHRCCQNSLLGDWAQSWMGHHSNAGYSNSSIIPARCYLFCQPQKDDTLSQPHLVLIQW